MEPIRKYKGWNEDDINLLNIMVKRGAEISEIAVKMCRTERSIRHKIKELELDAVKTNKIDELLNELDFMMINHNEKVLIKKMLQLAYALGKLDEADETRIREMEIRVTRALEKKALILN